MTESLRLHGENKYIGQHWIDLIHPKAAQDIDVDEIVSSVILKAGLQEDGAS